MIKLKEDTPGPSAKRTAAIMIAITLLVWVPFFTWYFLYRPISVDELASREFSPGDSVVVMGKIWKIERVNSTYGNHTIVYLDGETVAREAYGFIGESGREYRIGESFSTTLHFQKFYFNGKALITAPELYTSLLYLPSALEIPEDGTSFISGFVLIPESYDHPSNNYTVLTPSSDSYPLSIFNLTLIKMEIDKNFTYMGKTYFDHRTYPSLFAQEFLNINSEKGEIYDYMDSLLWKKSKNGVIEFRDENSDGLLDDGDVFCVNIPPEESNVFQTYLLQINGPGGPNGPAGSFEYMVRGLKYIINGEYGIYERKASSYASLHLSSIIKTENGCKSRIEIRNTAPEKPLLREVNFKVLAGRSYGKSDIWVLENLGDVDEYCGDQKLYVKYVDNNSDMHLNEGDYFIIEGNYSHFTLGLEGQNFYGNIEWCVRYGHVSGNLPRINGEVLQTADNSKLLMKMSYSHPALSLSNITLSIHIQNITFSGISVFSGGILNDSYINVMFVDADGDGHLSNGDYFVIASPYTWKIEIEVPCRSYTFKNG